MRIWCTKLWFDLVLLHQSQLTGQGQQQGVQGYLLLQPSYVSEWRTIKSKDPALSELTFEHGLHEMPVKVVAVVKVGLPDGKEYSFQAVGTAQMNNDNRYYFGGIVCLYNETTVKVYAPNSATGSVVYLGDIAWDGVLLPDKQRLQHLLPTEGAVQVKAYSTFDFPHPDFHVTWTPLKSREAPYVFEHGLDRKPDVVVVQIKGANSGLVSEAQGSVSIINPRRSAGYSGVIFGYSQSSIRIWTVYSPVASGAKLFYVGNGWGSTETNIEETHGFIRIFAWNFGSFPCETIFKPENILSQYSPIPITTPACRNLEEHFLSVETEVTKGPNKGYTFPAVGSVMKDSADRGDTSGLLYAYAKDEVIVWKPRKLYINYNGYLAAVSTQWGDSNTTQTTNDVNIEVTIWRHYNLLGDICNKCLAGKFGRRQDYSYSIDGFIWRCSNKKCNRKVSVRPADINCEEDYGLRFNLSTPAAVVQLTSKAYNATIQMSCMKAYKMTGGNNTVVCTRQGVYSGDPIECEEITCPGVVGNNSITNGWTYIEGVHLSNKSFSGCNTGFSLKDPSAAVRNCTETEEWSNVDPICEEITCPSTVSEVEAASFTMLGNKYNDQLKYECQPGFPHIKGDLIRTCQSDGNWSGITPVCEYCMCDCTNTTSIQIYDENLEELLKRLIQQLTVKKNETSLAKRAKISVYEDRPTAKGLGGLGCFLLVTCFLLIVVPDIPILIRHIKGVC